MIKILLFAMTTAEVATASACAALVRASGHKARAVDATLLTKADREAADLLFASEDAAPIVRAAYDDKPVIVATFNPADFMPDAVAAAVAWARGEGEQPTFGKPAATKQDHDSNGDGKLTVAEIKAALTAKGIEIPEGAKKAELQGLLDAANTPT